MQIEQWPIDRVIPYARNARTLSPAAVAKVAASIKEFGWQQPIVVDADRVIIAGHTRLLAARQLGLAQVPVLVASGLSPAQVKAYRLMDNRSHEETGWDFGLVGPELQDLRDSMGFDLQLTGFDAAEIAAFFAGPVASGQDARRTLAERFIVPPFSVLDARQGYWQTRKNAWLALGIKSEIGRAGGAGTPPHPPTVTQNPDGTLNYGGTDGQAQRFDRQRANVAPGRSPRPANKLVNGKTQRGDGVGRPLTR